MASILEIGLAGTQLTGSMALVDIEKGICCNTMKLVVHGGAPRVFYVVPTNIGY